MTAGFEAARGHPGRNYLHTNYLPPAGAPRYDLAPRAQIVSMCRGARGNGNNSCEIPGELTSCKSVIH